MIVALNCQGCLISFRNLDIVDAPAQYFGWVWSYVKQRGRNSSAESHLEAVQRCRKPIAPSLDVRFFSRPAGKKSPCSFAGK